MARLVFKIIKKISKLITFIKFENFSSKVLIYFLKVGPHIRSMLNRSYHLQKHVTICKKPIQTTGRTLCNFFYQNDVSEKSGRLLNIPCIVEWNNLKKKTFLNRTIFFKISRQNSEKHKNEHLENKFSKLGLTQIFSSYKKPY